MNQEKPLVINGWALLAHPAFLEPFEELIVDVERLRDQNPKDYQSKGSTKRLAVINKLIFDVIPSDPTLPEYRQGDTLGKENKYWFRAKFGQQYRLFFRYHKRSKIIIYGWVNGPDTLRAYGRKTDAYAVFSKKLAKGHPPGDWSSLKYQSRKLLTPTP